MLPQNKFQNSQRKNLSMETLERRELFAVNPFNSGLIAAQGPIADSALVAAPAININRINIGDRIGGIDEGGGVILPRDYAKVYEYRGDVYAYGTNAADNITIDTISRRVGDPTGMSRFRVTIANKYGIVQAKGDFTSFGNSEVFVYGKGGNDTIRNSSSISTQMFGGGNDDTLISGPGNDRMDGGYGNDTYNFLSNAGRGPLGDDQVIDVGGYDTLNFFALRGGVRVSASTSQWQHVNYNLDLKIEGIRTIEHIIGTYWDDTITGSYGDDLIEGGGGNDVIRGGFGNDILRGGDGNDMLFGDSGEDTLYGDQGMDTLRGGYQNDKLHGGRDNDVLFGGLGDDELHGGRQDDVLYGDAGNDTLRGGFGNDALYGGAGNDGLLGGDGLDRLFGQTGADRYLVFDAPSGFDGFVDTVMDATSADAVITLIDGDARSYVVSETTYNTTGGQWTSYEIATLDEALAAAHKRTKSTSLFKSNGETLKLYRYGTTDGSFRALGGGSNLWFFEGTFNRGHDATVQTVLQEIGHGQDNENPMWSEFLALSGWRQTDPQSSAFEQSGDKKWWYRDDAEFSRNYAKTNPREDFGTAFSAYFMRELELDFKGYPASSSGEVGADAIDNGPDSKIAFMDQFFDSLQPKSKISRFAYFFKPAARIAFK